MFCATVLYPNQEGRTFDFDHYAKALAPIYAKFLGDNCVRYEARRGLVTPGAPMPAFGLIASYWVRSDKDYGESLRDPGFPEVMAKFAAFSDVQPIRQFDEVLTADR
jgi:uncharacterized protein (TIGR02118 family)